MKTYADLRCQVQDCADKGLTFAEILAKEKLGAFSDYKKGDLAELPRIYFQVTQKEKKGWRKKKR